MAATNVPITVVPIGGTLDLAAIEAALHVADGAVVANDGRTQVLIHNAGGGGHIITVTTPQTVGGNAVGNPTFSIGAGDWAALPYLPPDTFNEQSGANSGKVFIDSDGTKTEVRVVALRQVGRS